jgi:hypothetical protein
MTNGGVTEDGILRYEAMMQLFPLSEVDVGSQKEGLSKD